MTDAQTLLQRIAELEAQNALLEQQAKQQAAINLLLEQQSKQQQQQLIHAQKIETKLQTALKKVQQENEQLYCTVLDLIEKQKKLIHQLYGQKSEGLTAKQDHLNQESALEDLSALEQIRDDYRKDISQEELAGLPTVEPIEAESLISQDPVDLSCIEKQTNPKIKRPRHAVIPDNLDVKTIVHKPATTICACGCQMKQIGQDKQDKLGMIPKRFYIERHVYPKYTCNQCDRQRLVQAKTPPQIIDKSISTPELLAHILISKYADHQLLYRQNLIYLRSGVNIPDATMADWVGRCGVALEPLVKRLHELLLTQPILHADETPVNILKFNNNKGKLKQGYVWAYLTPQHCQSYGGFKAVVYDFAESRRNEHPKAFLDKWQGQLICDDYNGYKCLFKQKQAVIEVGCMAHARRKFHELHIKGQSLVAHEALALFQKLYAVECQIDALFEKNETPSPRVTTTVVTIRQQHAKPIAKALYRWLQEKRLGTTKNASITKAIEYCLKRWQALTRYLEDGSLPIDNNWAENQMRPWALGRKNWLFAGSLKSGQRAAVIMSLIQSARLNGLDVYAYLSDVLKRLPTHKDKDIDELLPHVWKMQ